MNHALEVLKREKRVLESKLPMISFLPKKSEECDADLNDVNQAIAVLEGKNT